MYKLQQYENFVSLNNNSRNNNNSNSSNYTDEIELRQPLLHLGIVGVYDRSLPASWIAIPLVIVLGIIVLNAIQIWCIKKKFYHEFNPLMIIIMSLAVADLVVGVVSLLAFLLMTIERHALKGSPFLLYLIKLLFTTVANYLFTVSLISLVTFTMLKTIRITRNEWYNKKIVKRICLAIWVTTFPLCCADFVFHEIDVYPPSIQRSIQRLWIPAISIPSFVVFICCYIKIIFTIRESRRTNPATENGRARSSGNSLKIAICHIVVMSLCVGPTTICQTVSIALHINIERRIALVRLLSMLLLLNSLFDPIMFIIVFRRKLANPSRERNVQYNHRVARIQVVPNLPDPVQNN